MEFAEDYILGHAFLLELGDTSIQSVHLFSPGVYNPQLLPQLIRLVIVIIADGQYVKRTFNH